MAKNHLMNTSCLILTYHSQARRHILEGGAVGSSDPDALWVEPPVSLLVFVSISSVSSDTVND